jgi:hypothetical protein
MDLSLVITRGGRSFDIVENGSFFCTRFTVGYWAFPRHGLPWRCSAA